MSMGGDALIAAVRQGVFPCIKCPLKLKTYEDFLNHLQSDHPDYICSKCGDSWHSNKFLVRQHTKHCNNGYPQSHLSLTGEDTLLSYPSPTPTSSTCRGKFPCAWCTVDFESYVDFIRHVHSYHPEYICQKCNAWDDDAFTIQRHKLHCTVRI